NTDGRAAVPRLHDQIVRVQYGQRGVPEVAVLVGHDHTDSLGRHDAPRALKRLLEQCHAAIQRAVLLGHYTTLSISRQCGKTRPVTAGKHDSPGVISRHGEITRVALAGWTREEAISVRHAPLDEFHSPTRPAVFPA